MTDKQINEAIARRLNYSQCTCGQANCDSYKMPDYCSDLNAMHKAKKTLTYEQRHAYASQFVDDEAAFAGARECAEAFLKAAGKWEDGK